MTQKIKQLLEFLRLALRGGARGVIGVLAIPVLIYMLYIAIFADGGLIQLVQKIRAENNMTFVVSEKQARLDNLNMHINLIKSYSPDYIEELVQKHLNMAAPDVRILK